MPNRRFPVNPSGRPCQHRLTLVALAMSLAAVSLPASATDVRGCESPDYRPAQGDCARLPGVELFYRDTGAPAGGNGQTVVFVHAAQKAPDFGTENLLHQDALGPNHIDLEAAAAKRGRNFESDKARPDHNRSARRLNRLNKRLAIGETAQVMNMRKIRAGNPEPDRSCAGGQ